MTSTPLSVPHRSCPPPTRRGRIPALLALLSALGVLSGEPAGQSASAQPAITPAIPAPSRLPADRPTASPFPSIPESVGNILAAAYLTDDQRRDKRIFFGRWTSADLDTPARAARAALIRGVYDDPALAPDDTDADPLDRAEAALRRGDHSAVATLLDSVPDPSPRAVRIRAAMLEDQAKFEDALRIAQPVLDAMAARKLTSASDIVEGVRLMLMRTRLRGPVKSGAAADDYKAMISRLDEVLNRVDRLYWPAMFLQAEILAAKDNKMEAAQSLEKTLELNPTSNDTWRLLGRMMVDSFSFPQAEGVAKRLDILASDWTGEDPDPLPADLEAADPGAISPDGAMIAARILLRRSEGTQAVAVLEPHLARYPRSAPLQALKCAALAVSFDFAAADVALAEFDRTFGKSPLARYETGKALSDARQYAQSRVHLEEAAKRQPMAAEPYIDLGLMLLQAGKDADALTALERAFRLDPFNIRADNSLRVARELQTYEKVESPHFIIRYKPGSAPDGTAGDGLLAREMVVPLEANYNIVTGSQPGGIDFEPKEKTIIDLMPNHQWFGVRIAGMPQIHTIAASTGPVIAMESPREGANHYGSYDWARVLRHEYTHTVNLGRTNNRIPHWFTEASAVYLELSPRDYSTCQLLAGAHKNGGLFDFLEINMAFVRPKKPADRSLAYAQGHWMYEYIMLRAGTRAPLDLMDKYAAGVREEEAFQSVIGVSRAQFLADFLAWSGEQLIDWGMEVPKGTPSLRALLAREALIQNPGGNAGAEAPPAPKPEEPKPTDQPEKIADKQPDPPALPDEKPKLDEQTIATLKRWADDQPGDDDVEIELPEPTADMIAKWLAAWPRHPDVLELALDEALDKSAGKATPDNVPLIERYAAARPVDPKPHRLLAKMYLDHAAADPSAIAAEAAKAIPHLEFIDQREQKYATYAMELAQRYAALGNIAQARAKAERATWIDPFSPRPREVAATVAIQAKDWPTAERHITALTLIEPKQEIHRRRLEALERLKNQQ